MAKTGGTGGDGDGRKSGRFVKGVSGNPRGRRKGTKNRVSREASDLLAGASREIVGKLIERAKEGHAVALKLCIERLIPRAGHAVELDLPKVERAGDIAAAVASVIAACAGGELTIEEADRVMMMLDRHRSALATDELLIRVAALEEDELRRAVLGRRPS